MRRFLLPLLFATLLSAGMVATGHALPTSFPIVETVWLATAAISIVAAIPLFMLGAALDVRHHNTAGIRHAEKIAMRTLKWEERRKKAEADAAELKREHFANGDFKSETTPSSRTNGGSYESAYSD